MIYSLSEIDAQAKKAVRGAGFEWGCAEEAGKAARLLAAYQLPGVVVLADYLQQRAGNEALFRTPLQDDGVWRPREGGLLCPLVSGECLSDGGRDALAGELVLENVAAPLLLLPCLLLMAREYDCAQELRWAGVHLVCHADRLEVLKGDALSVGTAERIECACVARDAGGVAAGNLGQDIEAEVWQQLDGFAKRTYVAATEASRRGAGPAD